MSVSEKDGLQKEMNNQDAYFPSSQRKSRYARDERERHDDDPLIP
jgi:hypothetical protein